VVERKYFVGRETAGKDFWSGNAHQFEYQSSKNKVTEEVNHQISRGKPSNFSADIPCSHHRFLSSFLVLSSLNVSKKRKGLVEPMRTTFAILFISITFKELSIRLGTCAIKTISSAVLTYKRIAGDIQ
jgi:hypothetical protein